MPYKKTRKRGGVVLWMSSWIASRLKWFVEEIAERGFEIFIICSTDVDRRLVLKEHEGIVNEVISISEVFERFWAERKNLEVQKVITRARQNEGCYGIYLMDLIRADRHLGRGFIKGGWFPRSLMSETLGYYEYLDIINRMLEFLESFFSRHDFRLFVTEVASFPTKAACVVARKNGVEIRVPHPSRIGDLYFLAHNEFLEVPRLESHYRRILADGNLLGPEITDSYEQESYGLAKSEIHTYLEYRGVPTMLKGILQQIVVQGYRRIKNYSVYSPYYLRDRIKSVWLYHRGIRAFEKRDFTTRSACSGESYVLYPLQLEPESAMLVMSPEFTHQEYLVHLLASNLPAGWSLIIKEHPLALGTRPRGFYDSIERYPNVKLANPLDSAREWYLGSQAVGMITGSVGYEAAMEGVPVISFGKHNHIEILDHVIQADSHESVRSAIDRIRKGEIPDQRERRRQGNALREALKEISFPLNGSPKILKANEDEVAQELALFVDKLLESLNHV